MGVLRGVEGKEEIFLLGGLRGDLGGTGGAEEDVMVMTRGLSGVA